MRMQRMSDEAIAVQIGQAIRERRLRKNITQDELAESAGVSTPTLQKLEKGKGTIANLITALRALGSLDLLVPVLTPPPVSPLAVSQARSARARVRAAPSSSGRGKTLTAANNASLLIPRKSSNGGSDGEDS